MQPIQAGTQTAHQDTQATPEESMPKRRDKQLHTGRKQPDNQNAPQSVFRMCQIIFLK